MPGLVIALLLALSLSVVLFSVRSRPLPTDRPLNVDDRLPLPELAQSSTVFSLTALFGAYYGIAVTVGLPALIGLAVGTVLGLFLIRLWIEQTLSHLVPEQRTFEAFLFSILDVNKKNGTVYAVTISLTQCIYAACELLILRQLLQVALGLKAEQATMLACGLGLIGYFYMLFGGYLALFRTDLIQVGLVSLMAVAIFLLILFGHTSLHLTAKWSPQPSYWDLPIIGQNRLAHFVIAAIMSLGQLVASPDTWKRVFQVSRRTRGPVGRVLILVCVGALPYLALVPIALVLKVNPTGHVNQEAITSPLLGKNYVFAAIALALVACFLSAFNSALLASVHIQLMQRRVSIGKKLEEAAFYSRMVTTLLTIAVVFVGGLVVFNNESLFGFKNAWLFGNLLMGAYAAIAGVQFATRGDISRLREFSLVWIFAIIISAWLLYFYFSAGFSKEPNLHSVNTVPAGVVFFFATLVLTRQFRRSRAWPKSS